mmetsp:Transcript_34549/g.108293  ORF Transcript_34549/g.108293 Transcript_34549/m.108293 type:complete len:324 (+) Transcript_34549:1350-2321(+)
MFLPVLSPVDHLGGSSQHVGPVGLEREGKIVGDLSSEGHDSSGAALDLVDVEDSLQAQLLEVEPVALIEVSRHSLRVAVDHDGLLALSNQSAQAQHGAVVKLDAASNPVSPATHNHDAMVVEGNVTLSSVVGHVEIVGLSWELGRKGVNLFDNWSDAHPDSQLAGLSLRAADPLADLPVGEASLLGQEHHVLGNRLLVVVAEIVGEDSEVLELAQEPSVNLGDLVDAVDRVPSVVEGVGDGVDSVGSGTGKLLVSLLVRELGKGLKALPGGVDHPHGLLDALGEVTGNRHDLSNRSHLGSNLLLDAIELGEIPSWVLDDTVIE